MRTPTATCRARWYTTTPSVPPGLRSCLVLVVREVRTGKLRQLFVDVGSPLATWVNRSFLLLTAVLLVGFLALAMWQLWLRPAAEVRMEGIALGPVQLSIHDLAAILMIASLAVAVLTNTWPFYVWRLKDLWRSGRFFYGAIFLLIVLAGLFWRRAREVTLFD